MNENLQRRIQNLMGNESMPMQMQMGGEVEQPVPEMMPPQADNSMLESAINELMIASNQTTDPMESAKIEQMAEGMKIAAEAPMAAMAQELSAMGRGGDTRLAHVSTGEVVLPPEMFDDPEFEKTVESRFNELDLDPERYVVGVGIASLNPETGLEEFFLKKIAKFVKKAVKKVGKVVKKVAPVAMFIPGVGTALGGVLGGIGGLATKIPGIGTALGNLGSTVASGIGSLNIPGISTIAKGTAGGFGGIGKALGTKAGLFGGGPLANLMGVGDDIGLSALSQAEIDALSPDQLAALQQQDKMIALQKSGFSVGDYDKIGEAIVNAGGQPTLENILKVAQIGNTNQGNLFSNLISGTGADDKGNFGYLGDALASVFGQGGQQGFGLGGLGGLGIAGLLGKLAYDEAKNRRGVPLTPMTQMDAMGRYNIEAEIARRMGQEAPNPVEFGLMPANTIPQLSGGRPEEPVGMQAGGSVSSVPEGMKEFFLTTHISDMTVGQQDMLRDLINNDPVFAEAYYQSDDLRMPEAFDVVTNVTEEFPRLDPITRKGVVSLAKRLKAKNRRMPGDAELNRFMKSRTGQGLSDVEKSLIINQVKEMRNMYMGGPVMAYADGGNVSDEDFKRKTGKINGPGTETSDDIPAMLSDGEFVFKSQSVRGAGAFDMNKKRGGIIELVPNKEESRERGTDLMYEMMDLFSSYAKKRA